MSANELVESVDFLAETLEKDAEKQAVLHKDQQRLDDVSKKVLSPAEQDALARQRIDGQLSMHDEEASV